MLTCLRVKNLAIIEDLEMELGPGLNVVTGETGSGKSILVGALTLVLGARGSPSWLRTGADEAEVEALFELGADDERVIRRVLQASGRSRGYVDGQLATAAQLRELSAGLVDISSQHAHHTLVDSSTHLDFLDGYARLGELRARVGVAHDAAATAAAALRDLRARARDRADRVDLLRLQLSEVAALDPQPGEDVAIDEELARLAYSDALLRGAESVERELTAKERSVCSRLVAVASTLESMARHDARLADLHHRVDAARLELEDVAGDVARYAARLDADPARLELLEERRQRIRRLCRRFGGTLDTLLAWRGDAHVELATLDDLDGHLERRESEADAALRDAATAARALSRARHEAARALGAAIGRELADLGMGGAVVHVDVAPLDGDGLQVDGSRLSRTGIDRVEFHIAPNPGEEPRPLARVASGGELSRALLAVKRVLAAAGPVGLYVFDEVDTGVGGAVAEAIGRKLREVSHHHQVLCVTHLAQVAAWADRHLLVAKEVRDGRTRSVVRVLDDGGRREEIARMMGGATVTEATRAAASDLLALTGGTAPPR